MTPELPLYDERFTDYGMNKISHIIELAILRYIPLFRSFFFFLNFTSLLNIQIFSIIIALSEKLWH